MIEASIQNKIEILSPAGSFEKLQYAILYGADAVYCAMDKFGMRAAADNFDEQQLKSAVRFVHENGKKIYVTVNVMPRDDSFSQLSDYLKYLQTVGVDAIIVSDPGVIRLAQKLVPSLEMHLSTQMPSVNAESCKFWHDLGIKRIVLSRELSLEQIKTIRDSTPQSLEFEIFIHGSMCVSYSGRCLLSNYYTSRDANEGKCTQPCRWKYYVTEEKRENDKLEITQDSEGSYLLSSRDLCMIEHIDKLVDSGIRSFKIEGRMKSLYYTAAVTNAYKMAFRDYQSGIAADDVYKNELESVSHREYDTGYYFASPAEDAKIINKNEYIKEKAFLATVESIDNHLAKCIQRNKMRVGDSIRVISPGKTGRSATVVRLFDEEMNEITSTPHASMIFYIDCGGVALSKYDILTAGCPSEI